MITGNKGEWSELYVLLRLLSTGKLYDANRSSNIFFPILKIIRDEVESRRIEYKIKDTAVVEIYINDEKITSMQAETFKEEADSLYQNIVTSKGSAFAIQRAEDFMSKIYCSKLKADSRDKTDITMQIHDIHSGHTPICGFSIKSEIGHSPTLINAGKTTNFIYCVEGLTDQDIVYVNGISTKTKIKDRMKYIFEKSSSVKFTKMSCECFSHNLMYIDTFMPEIMAQCLLEHYRNDTKTCLDVIANIEAENPLGFPIDGLYEYKYKKFLCATALGLKPATAWDGMDEANGGYIIVTAQGDVLVYHIYNRNHFEQYLLEQTRFEHPSTSRYDYAILYKKDGKMYLNLNLQIRF